MLWEWSPPHADASYSSPHVLQSHNCVEEFRCFISGKKAAVAERRRWTLRHLVAAPVWTDLTGTPGSAGRSEEWHGRNPLSQHLISTTSKRNRTKLESAVAYKTGCLPPSWVREIKHPVEKTVSLEYSWRQIRSGQRQSETVQLNQCY